MANEVLNWITRREPGSHTVFNRVLRAVLTQSGLDPDVGFPGFQNHPVLGAEVGVTAPQYPYGDVRRYGAAGDGATDDTAAIQNALDSTAALGGGVVIGRRDATYLVDSVGSKDFIGSSGSPQSVAYCLKIPSNVLADFAGATIRLTAGTAAVLVSNDNSADTTDSDLGIINAVLDGNNVSLAASGLALVWMQGVSRLRINVTVKNVKHIAGYFVNIDDSYFDRLELDTCEGQGFILGVPTSGLDVRNSHIGLVHCRNVTTESEPNFPGNPFYGVLTNCTVDTINCEDAIAGVKLDGPSADVAIGKIVLDGSTHVGGNSGLKFQGSASNGVCKRVTVGSVIAKNMSGHGLRFDQYSEDCHVESYVGESNAATVNFPDVWMDGTRNSVGQLKSLRCQRGVFTIRSTAVDWQIGRITALNANGAALSAAGVVSGGNGMIGQYFYRDDRGGGALTTRGIQIDSASARLRVGHLSVSGVTDKPVSVTAGASVDVGYGGVLSPAALSAGNNNNYDAGEARVLRLSADAAGSTLTGITKGWEGRRIQIVNVSANSLTVAHSTASSAVNQFVSPTGADVVLGQNDAAEALYDDTSDRWRIVSVLT